MDHLPKLRSLPSRRSLGHGLLFLALLALLAAAPATASDGRGGGGTGTSDGGEVRIPLEVYQRLLAGARNPDAPPVPTALGPATVKLQVTREGDGWQASLLAGFTVEVLGQGWTLVPVLPAGTTVSDVTVDGRRVRLVPGPEGLAWPVRESGEYRMDVRILAEVRRGGGGWILTSPLPAAPSLDLSASLPADAREPSVVPGRGVRISRSDDHTLLRATLPRSASLQVLWSRPAGANLILSRADYQGMMREGRVEWTGTFQVEAEGDGETLLPLIHEATTLQEILVDGEEAVVKLLDGRYAVPVQGAGRHTVVARFLVPVARLREQPAVQLSIPRVPVSRFELSLPGRKEVQVLPGGSITSEQGEDRTRAVAYLAPTDRVTFSWEEAIPEDLRTEEMQANASLYHLAHAEEGVLHLTARADYEITRGQASRFFLEVPPGVQLTRIDSSQGQVKDWRRGEGDQADRVTVFLDREVEGALSFVIRYERLFGADPASAERIAVPLLRALEVHRQRGMVALLSGSDLTLKPIEEAGATRVGENQLPPELRQSVSRTIAHTYKYFEDPPRLVVRAAAPERRAGKFDAQVDTLLSLGEVALKSSSTIEINVKSGSLMELVLEVPAGVNVLGLTGPSLRNQNVAPAEDVQRIEVAFTREMEGQFRLELQTERILTEGGETAAGEASELAVPAARVLGAEVEHGRLAVEALTAVEVKPVRVEHLSSLDVNELPRQLVLKTTNPILLAYKYVYAEPEWNLVLQVTRHQELEVQEAIIERASLRTLFTRDGLVVTRAEYFVRNSRKQFLRIDLPPGSEVWSVFVAGRAEKPAAARRDGDEAGGGESILVKLLNSTEGFPVEVVFATRGEALGAFGRLEGELPRPRMVVTQTTWAVYLPAGVRWSDPKGNLDLVDHPQEVGRAEMARELADLRKASAGQQQGPLRIHVPARGYRLSFEKLYAGQSADPVRFSIAYSDMPQELPDWLGVLAGLLLWLGPLWGLIAGKPAPRWAGPAGLLAGIGLVAGTVILLDAGLLLPLIGAGTGLVLTLGGLLLRRTLIPAA